MNWILVFFYIYPIVFTGIPLSTRIIFAMMGIGLAIYRRKMFPKMFSVLYGLIPISIISICTGILNGTYDFNFVFYAISLLAIFFAAYFIFSILKWNIDGTAICCVSKYIVGVICIQSILTLFMSLFGNFGEIMQSLVVMDEYSNTLRESTANIRFLGWGSYFFGAGVINGLGLILVIYLYLSAKINNIISVILFAVILLVGMLMARTTLVGFIVSLFFLLSWKWRYVSWIKTKIKWLFLFGGILISLLVVVFYFIDSNILLWAFELFFNFIEYGEFTSESTEDLQSMYVWPSSFKTYLIGDGLFNIDGGYYMHTDVGYLRLLYYGGVPTLLAYFFCSYWIIREILSLGISTLSKRLLYILFIYVIVLNFKGLVELNQVFILMYLFVYFAKFGYNIEN